ncbi:unnamed protein product [Linum trigynum]|uniref:Uncharacterized protein n=1 Tax=Linum trigynum TaxID=586398 RepID=A0AAV2GBA7_9ROSI
MEGKWSTVRLTAVARARGGGGAYGGGGWVEHWRLVARGAEAEGRTGGRRRPPRGGDADGNGVERAPTVMERRWLGSCSHSRE